MLVANSAAQTPPPNTPVARIVFDGMPGEGVHRLLVGERITPTTWASLVDAIRGTERITAGDEVGAAGIFRRDGKYTAHALNVEGYHASKPTPLHTGGDDYVARTVPGRSLLTIIDGGAELPIMSAKEFRYYERYAGGE